MKPGEQKTPIRPRRVGILIFDEVEVLDFCGPFEVFSTARLDGEARDGARLFDVLTIAEEQMVQCIGGLSVRAHHTLDDHPALDILVVPGGYGTRRALGNSRLLDWIAAQDQRTELTTSVCTGAFLLAERGILDGLQATTHWSSVDWMREQYPHIEMLGDMRVVDTGHVVTSAGISAGIDMALHVVARLHGDSAAAWTARRMEYEWSAQYRSIFESSSDAIIITDPQDHIVEANAAACHIFGYTHAEMLGLRSAELVPPDQHDVFAAYLRAMQEDGTAATRCACLRKDGTRFHAEGRGTAFQYQGEPRLLSMLRDITERVEAELAVQEERQRLSRELHDSVSQALYSIALANKTARALLDRNPAGAAEPLDFAIAQAARGLAEMRALIFDLRPEALEQEGLIAALARQVQVLQMRHDMSIDTSLCEEPDVPLAVKEGLYRIVQEALNNTVKHAEATQVHIHLTCTGEEVALQIRDNGKGFDSAGSFPGHLGLHSMHERATRLGGILEIESTAGAGTVIRVRLPHGGRAPSAAPAQR